MPLKDRTRSDLTFWSAMALLTMIVTLLDLSIMAAIQVDKGIILSILGMKILFLGMIGQQIRKAAAAAENASKLTDALRTSEQANAVQAATLASKETDQHINEFASDVTLEPLKLLLANLQLTAKTDPAASQHAIRLDELIKGMESRLGRVQESIKRRDTMTSQIVVPVPAPSQPEHAKP